MLGEPPEFVRRLRIYPHALREANAYYSPRKKALLFGYFTASPRSPIHAPGNVVFTCLSHDIVAHEVSHALLDGVHPLFGEVSNPDVFAFHEAFADLVALFQHFSHGDVLRDQIAKTGGDLDRQNLLGELAQEFGQGLGHGGALRDALGAVDRESGEWRPHVPDPSRLARTTEPHSRGAILVAAVFDAFVEIYKRRVSDLVRIAGGRAESGRRLSPELVDRMADEAAKSAHHVLRMCIRAIDYCPPVDVTFGDYLRALVTSDSDLFADDPHHYRVALVEAFRRHGIYPRGVRSLSVDTLRWHPFLRVDRERSRELVAEIERLFGAESDATGGWSLAWGPLDGSRSGVGWDASRGKNSSVSAFSTTGGSAIATSTRSRARRDGSSKRRDDRRRATRRASSRRAYGASRRNARSTRNGARARNDAIAAWVFRSRGVRRGSTPARSRRRGKISCIALAAR